MQGINAETLTVSYKKYLVIANGKFEKDKGELEDYLLKNQAKNSPAANDHLGWE